MRVLIAGGGTGGHLYPGIAVAEELRRRDAATTVSFVGTGRGLESRVVPGLGFALDLIRSAGLKGKSITALARGLALLPLSAVDAWRVISRRRPDVVVGVGGYSSGPVLLLAALRRHPDATDGAEHRARVHQPGAGTVGSRRCGQLRGDAAAFPRGRRGHRQPGAARSSSNVEAAMSRLPGTAGCAC